MFLNAFKYLSRFEHRSSVKTWLLTITRNRSLNYLNSSFLKRVTLTDIVTHRYNGISAEKEALDRLNVNQIWDCVLQLPIKI
ncbi:RNA polymerase sigma factor [Paenibacillus glacialis]|uniref:RNA polymerase sigma factor n=1 Tax=Paenibacillus glacialis TaxID=494026 RepID=UPI001FE160FC|nr:sigma factor [Paenibacillus glacialis]